jgi:hypothetical protein
MKLFAHKLTIDEKKAIGEELFFQDCEFCCSMVNFNDTLYFVEVDKNDDEEYEPGKECEIKVYRHCDNDEYDELVSSCFEFPIKYKVIGSVDNEYRTVALTERNPDYYSIIALFMEAHGYEDWKFEFEKE